MKNNLHGFAAVIALGVALFAAAAAGQQTQEPLEGVKVISAEEGKRMLERGVPLIDTRQFDLRLLPADKDAPVVFRSYKASVLARDAGYKQIHWLKGS